MTRRSNRPCEHCGVANRGTRPVRVEPIRQSAPAVGRLFLCASCVEGDGRTWRRRWRPVAGL
jgi:hypothetical protein